VKSNAGSPESQGQNIHKLILSDRQQACNNAHKEKSKSNPSNITTPFNINTMNTALGIKHLLQNSQCTRIKHTCYKCC